MILDMWACSAEFIVEKSIFEAVKVLKDVQ